MLVKLASHTVCSTVLPPLFKQASGPEFSRRSRLGQTGELVTQECDGFRKFKKTRIVQRVSVSLRQSVKVRELKRGDGGA